MPHDYELDDLARLLTTSATCSHCKKGILNWIQSVKLFERPKSIVLTARCNECAQVIDVVVTLQQEGR